MALKLGESGVRMNSVASEQIATLMSGQETSDCRPSTADGAEPEWALPSDRSDVDDHADAARGDDPLRRSLYVEEPPNVSRRPDPVRRSLKGVLSLLDGSGCRARSGRHAMSRFSYNQRWGVHYVAAAYTLSIRRA
jgi:hypothetical protein